MDLLGKDKVRPLVAPLYDVPIGQYVFDPIPHPPGHIHAVKGRFADPPMPSENAVPESSAFPEVFKPVHGNVVMIDSNR
jgi:hypothetical protein